PRGDTSHPVGDPVTILVDKGPEQAIVPPVRGKPEEEARKALDDLAFSVTVSYEPAAGVNEGIAFAVEPVEGSQVNKGSRVILKVKREPTPTATPTHAPPTATPTARR
ncbi:MAG TPA: PASTA domain-containing protein, partial [Chloroflexota bacterium]|nr:PASTA domain-containing protein [Chloroflexota bacterium]